MASFVLEHGFWSTGSAGAVYRLSCPVVYEIFLDWGLKPSPLHWHVGSYPLFRHGGALGGERPRPWVFLNNFCGAQAPEMPSEPQAGTQSLILEGNPDSASLPSPSLSFSVS